MSEDEEFPVDDSDDDVVDTAKLTEITSTNLSPLMIDAIEMHEYFCAFTSGGFTEEQALRLVSYVFEGSATVAMVIEDDDDFSDDDDFPG